MRRTLVFFSIFVGGGLLLGTVCAAQPPAGERGPGGSPRPFQRSLDLNHDNKISAAEIASSSASLLALDANHDGQLTPDEMRPRPSAGRDMGEGERCPPSAPDSTTPQPH